MQKYSLLVFIIFIFSLIFSPFVFVKAAFVPNDPDFLKQWYLSQIKAPEAWEKTTGSTEVIMALLDSGIDLDHPDLKDNLWTNSKEIAGDGIDNDKNGYIDDIRGWDFVSNDNDPSPDFNEPYTEAGINHGTIIAGVAAARGNNELGITGLSWQSKIMVLKVLNGQGQGNSLAVERAIDYAIIEGASIINLSFVGIGKTKELEEMIERAYKAGLVIVAASGNDNQEREGHNLNDSPMYPICYDQGKKENMIIGVGSTDPLDQKSLFSNYGSSCLDVVAPGVGFYSTLISEPKQGFDRSYGGYWSGTSVAAPLVSGLVALLKSLNKNFTNQEIINLILDNSDDISTLNPRFSGGLGKGRINVKRTVEAALKAMAENQIAFAFRVEPANILVAPLGQKSPIVKKVKSDGTTLHSFLVASPLFKGGLSLVSGDINQDGSEEIVIGLGPGNSPEIFVFESEGALVGGFEAYDREFRGGVNVGVADLDGDKNKEMVTTPMTKGGPEVRIFNHQGLLVNKFFAYHPKFRGGVNLALGDVDGDGISEIITGAGRGGGPQVRIFRMDGTVLGQFFAYDSRFRGGSSVAAVDIDGDGKVEIITGAGPGGGPHLRIFDSHSKLLNQFFAYHPRFRGGVTVAAADIDADGRVEIITGAGPGGGPQVRIFDLKGQVKKSFFVFEESFRGGIRVAVGK